MSDNKKGRILGLDYGRRRIGVAQSDPLNIVAQSLPTITVKNRDETVREIEQLVKKNSIVKVVVGMPLNLRGEKGVIAEEISYFIQQLQETLKIPVIEWDERMTSVAAKRTLHELGKSPSRNKSKVDQIAALLILQNYLDYINR